MTYSVLMGTLNTTHSLNQSITHVYHFPPLVPHLIVQRENLTEHLSLFPALVKALETHMGEGVCVYGDKPSPCEGAGLQQTNILDVTGRNCCVSGQVQPQSLSEGVRPTVRPVPRALSLDLSTLPLWPAVPRALRQTSM